MRMCDRGVQMLITTVGAFAAFSLMTIAVGTDYWLYSRGVCRTKSTSDNDTSRKNEEVMTHSGLWRTCCLEGTDWPREGPCPKVRGRAGASRDPLPHPRARTPARPGPRGRRAEHPSRPGFPPTPGCCPPLPALGDGPCRETGTWRVAPARSPGCWVPPVPGDRPRSASPPAAPVSRGTAG